MAIDPAEAKRALDRFHKHIGAAGETCRPKVAASDTTLIVYQRHHRDRGIDVIGIPRAGLREFIALLIEADRDGRSAQPGSFHFVARDDEGDGEGSNGGGEGNKITDETQSGHQKLKPAK